MVMTAANDPAPTIAVGMVHAIQTGSANMKAFGLVLTALQPLLVRALVTGNCNGLVDPKLENNYNKTEMFNMIEAAAAACVQHSAPKRPGIQVVRALDSQDDMPDLTNGIKYGQSQVFNQGQTFADMQKFRQMAFGNDTDTLEYDSGEYDRQTTDHSLQWRISNQRTQTAATNTS